MTIDRVRIWADTIAANHVVIYIKQISTIVESKPQIPLPICGEFRQYPSGAFFKMATLFTKLISASKQLLHINFKFYLFCGAEFTSDINLGIRSHYHLHICIYGDILNKKMIFSHNVCIRVYIRVRVYMYHTSTILNTRMSHLI